jgi:hypothetical protein
MFLDTRPFGLKLSFPWSYIIPARPDERMNSGQRQRADSGCKTSDISSPFHSSISFFTEIPRIQEHFDAPSKTLHLPDSKFTCYPSGWMIDSLTFIKSAKGGGILMPYFMTVITQ